MTTHRLLLFLAVGFAVIALISTGNAQSPEAEQFWPQWRGPNGDGTTLAEKAPTTWSETKNLKWKLKLPGYGASSPIIWNDRVYLTCYSGYGAGSRGGSPSGLMRHLVCVDAKTGKSVW